MEFGTIKEVNQSQIHYGKLRTIKALKALARGLKVIRWWVGTDSDTLIRTPCGDFRWRKIRLPLHRLKARVTEWMINTHYYGCDHVRENLLGFGIDERKLERKSYPVLYPQKVDKGKLKILIHLQKCRKNMTYKRWYYGADVAEELQKTFDAHYFIVDGSQDMQPFFAIADVCVLPKRGIGIPRLKVECELNNIPVYYQPENPNVADIIIFLQNYEKVRVSDRLHECRDINNSRGVRYSRGNKHAV